MHGKRAKNEPGKLSFCNSKSANESRSRWGAPFSSSLRPFALGALSAPWRVLSSHFLWFSMISYQYFHSILYCMLFFHHFSLVVFGVVLGVLAILSLSKESFHVERFVCGWVRLWRNSWMERWSMAISPRWPWYRQWQRLAKLADGFLMFFVSALSSLFIHWLEMTLL